MSKGERIAQELRDAFKGQCGPFGNEDPYLDGNRLGLHSQAGIAWYTFNDDGSVDWDISEEEIDPEYEDETDIEGHYDSVFELLDDDLDGWFMYFEDEKGIVKDRIKEILEEQEEGLTEAPDKSVELGWVGKGKRHPVGPSEFTEFEEGTTVEVAIPAFTLHYKVRPGYAFDKEAQNDASFSDVAVEFVLKDGERDAFVNHIKEAVEQSLLKQSGNEHKLRYYNGVWGDGLPLEPRLESKERFIKEEIEEETSKGDHIIDTIEMPHEEYTSVEDIIRINNELDQKAKEGKLIGLRKEKDMLMLAEPAINGIWTLFLNENGGIVRITLW